jgi:hypothetical protein
MHQQHPYSFYLKPRKKGYNSYQKLYDAQFDIMLDDAIVFTEWGSDSETLHTRVVRGFSQRTGEPMVKWNNRLTGISRKYIDAVHHKRRMPHRW